MIHILVGPFRQHQHMHGCLRLDVMEGQHMVIFIDFFAGISPRRILAKILFGS
jgi:hypothetical protein